MPLPGYARPAGNRSRYPSSRRSSASPAESRFRCSSTSTKRRSRGAWEIDEKFSGARLTPVRRRPDVREHRKAFPGFADPPGIDVGDENLFGIAGLGHRLAPGVDQGRVARIVELAAVSDAV